MATADITLTVVSTLDKPPTDPAAFIAQIRAIFTSRYRLAAVPGRPEELRATNKTGRVAAGHDHRVSIQYGCQTVRIRLMVGRRWTHVVDIQLGDPGWRLKILPEADVHFGFISPGMLASTK